MNLTVKPTGVNELLVRLQTRMKLPTLMAPFMTQLSNDIKVSIADKTPRISGALADSYTVAIYDSIAVITTPLVYGEYIETGERTDRRARAGVVRRRAGAVLMFYRTAQEFSALASARAQMLWDAVQGVWDGTG